MTNSTANATCVLSFDYSSVWTFEFFFGCLIPIVCLFGAVGNVINMLILCDKRFTNPTYTYLNVLAAVQFVTLVSESIYIAMLGMASFGYRTIGTLATGVLWPIFSWGTTQSLVLTVVYTAERLAFIRNISNCRNSERHQTKRARLICCFVIGTVTLLNLPRMLALTFNTETLCIGYRWSMKDSRWFGVYTLIRFVVFNIGCVVTLLVLNAILVGLVIRHHANYKLVVNRNRPMMQLAPINNDCQMVQRAKAPSTTSNATTRAEHQRSVTLTVIAATFLVFCCEAYVAAFNPVTEAFTWGRLNIDPVTKRLFRSSTFGALCLEYSGNIIVYYLFNRRFRVALLQKLRWGYDNVSSAANSSESYLDSNKS